MKCGDVNTKILSMLFFCFLVVPLVSGCALTRDYVNLSYIPEKGVSKVEGAETVKVTVEVSDKRLIKDKVSCKKNGYGMEMASIISNDDVTKTVTDAIRMELVNRGFNVSDGSIMVSVELSKFYSDFKIGFWVGRAVAEVIMNAQVKKPDGNISFSKIITGQYTHRNVFLCSGKNAKIALDAALKDAVSKLANDSFFIKALIHSPENQVEKATEPTAPLEGLETKLKKLEELKAEQLLTEEEYLELRKKIINKH